MDIAFHALAGILLGGLVNALADNLAHGRFPGLPRYGDGSIRPAVAWLGIGAFLFNRRSPHDAKHNDNSKLSWRYPLTELGLAALLPATKYAASADAPIPFGQELLWQIYAIAFVLLAIVDIERKRIPTIPVIVTSLLALFDAATFPQQPPAFAGSLAGGVVGGLVFSLVYAGGLAFGRVVKSQREMPTAFGQGDIYLMVMGGLIVGFPNVLAAMVAAIFLGGLGALAYILASSLLGRGYRKFMALPYGPYILVATYCVMLFPDVRIPGF